MITITSKCLHLTASFPIEISELKLTAEAMIFVNKNKEGHNVAEVDFADLRDITYMGIPIDAYEGWRKFSKFHNEMGIDFNTAIDNKFREVMNDDAVNYLIKDLDF
jgi:hypothetical protein